ncbi:MAG: hypothetical protein ACI9HE_002816, partial [Planctomycetota bacterium]
NAARTNHTNSRSTPLTRNTMRAHPHFNDRGTLDWHTDFSEALAAAKDQGKLLFIEFGREL